MNQNFTVKSAAHFMVKARLKTFVDSLACHWVWILLVMESSIPVWLSAREERGRDHKKELQRSPSLTSKFSKARSSSGTFLQHVHGKFTPKDGVAYISMLSVVT